MTITYTLHVLLIQSDESTLSLGEHNLLIKIHSEEKERYFISWIHLLFYLLVCHTTTRAAKQAGSWDFPRSIELFSCFLWPNTNDYSGAHFNLEIGMLEQLKGRTFKILKNKNLENYKLENQNLEKQKSWTFKILKKILKILNNRKQLLDDKYRPKGPIR